MHQKIRFGHQLSSETSAEILVAAQRAEALGFDTVLIPDHIGPGLSPLPTLAAIAQATESIRLGTFVLNAEMRNPVQLAWEAATIDHLSNGRFELGLGAGHTPHEFYETGVELRPPAVRKERLAQQVEIIRLLLDGAEVNHESEYFHLDRASIRPAVQDHLPIMVGGNGKSLLTHAGTHADIIGLQGLGRTLADGHRHEVRWDAKRLDQQIQQVHDGAAKRSEDQPRLPELNALVQVFSITDDSEAEIAALCQRVDGLTSAHIETTPYVLIGSVAEIAEKISACESRWGISYFVVRDLDAFAPVLDVFR